MQQSTGTRIQIPGQAMPGETHRIATVSGKPEATEQVKGMIQRIIQEQSSNSVTMGSGYSNQYGGGGGGGWGGGGGYNNQQHAYGAHNNNYGAAASYAPAAAAPAPASTDHYEPFFRYAYYYGEETARAYYKDWSPPVGTPNPYGVNPNLGAAAPAPAAPAPAAPAPAPAAPVVQQQQAPPAPQQQQQTQAPAPPAPQQQQQQQQQPRETSRRHVSNLPAWMNKS